MAVDTFVKFWDLVKDNDLSALTGIFANDPHVEDPCGGSVRGLEEFKVYVDDIRSKFYVRKARVECFAILKTPKRVICEWVIHVDLPKRGGVWPCPLAAVADVNEEKNKLSSIRVYHSTWPQTGSHGIRLPLMPEVPVVLEGAVADYQKALAEGDVDGIIASFESDGYAREPSGGPYEYKGTEKLREVYQHMFANGGGIPLRHCTATDDGTSCAIEYICDKWGKSVLPPQAGVAVYERGASGSLHAARIYDDVEPPTSNDG